MDGAEVASDTTKSAVSYSAGDGRIVVGRWYTDKDDLYVSMQIDELLFFNRTLTPAEIGSLVNAA